jgi:3-deoxy-manno-octulosonate cytidylyltransferase (CMP-KDO synthetase)
MRAIGVIPARYGSTRLEGKPLADICGKPMVQHVYENACRASALDSVVVATDDERVRSAVAAFGGEAVMTSPLHSCGTERVAEVARHYDAAIVVNIQGDEPLMDPGIINECVRALRENPGVGLATVRKTIPESAFADPSVVKVVCDARGRALYFSRSLIPYPRYRTESFAVFEHVGIYAYMTDCLERLSRTAPSALEQIEALEQLRALENGIAIQVVETGFAGELVSVDTQEDLERVRVILAQRAFA